MFIGLFLLLTLGVGAADADDDGTGELAAALERASHQAEPHLHLVVHRTDSEGRRALELFPSGFAIWNGRSQIELDQELRSELVSLLIEHDFLSMAPVYGGRKRPGKAGEAAMRVSCQVELEIGGSIKSSVQLADGEQSAELASLAEGVLDLAEPLAEQGISALDLSDGLRKLAKGELAAESLELRFVRLPPPGSEQDGAILMIGGGTQSLQAYAPGRHLGDEVESEVTAQDLTALVEALLEADVGSLPVNQWSTDHVEVTVQVLGHRVALIGRDFSGRSADDQGEAQQRFNQLISSMRDYEAGLASDPDR